MPGLGKEFQNHFRVPTVYQALFLGAVGTVVSKKEEVPAYILMEERDDKQKHSSHGSW